jgi:hypothetical protein
MRPPFRQKKEPEMALSNMKTSVLTASLRVQVVKMKLHRRTPFLM